MWHIASFRCDTELGRHRRHRSNSRQSNSIFGHAPDATGRSLHSALHDDDGSSRTGHRQRKPLLGLRRLLQLFAELAALHDRGGCRSRSDTGEVRQRPAVRHALQRRPLFGIIGQGGCRDVLRHLCGAARGMPDLYARRSRMRDGAEAARVAGVGVTRPGDPCPKATPGHIPRDLSLRHRGRCLPEQLNFLAMVPAWAGRIENVTPSPLRRGLRRRSRRRSGRRWRAAWSRA